MNEAPPPPRFEASGPPPAPNAATSKPDAKLKRPLSSVRFRSQDEVYVVQRFDEADHHHDCDDDMSWPRGSKSGFDSSAHVRPTGLHHSPLPQGGHSMMQRLGAGILLLVAVVTLCSGGGLGKHNPAVPIQGVSGGVVPEEAKARGDVVLEKRQEDSPEDVCIRWSHQSALVNGTLYLYGGEATTEARQSSNTWNNNFLTLDLTKSWQIGSPSLTGLPQPSGPPPVALGYLWNSFDSLFLYGGQFSDDPERTPDEFATWEYDISDEQWIEHTDPVTSEGESAPSNDDPVQRSAEGAGANVPSLGRGFYFGGHLDAYTTRGWSVQVARLYLQSLIEFTFPGNTNDQVDALSDGDTAGSGGVYRNITQGGLQDDAGFTARADALLTYVPGFGDQGILLAVAGGTNDTFTQMNNIDIYDIATTSWYKQSTSGPTPELRVNPCGVAAAAPDGSSTNIYMFGGQSLQPYGNQTLYDDMWILTLPSFTWIEVDQSDQSVPYGRAGHSCNIWDAQMVMVGGYVGDQLSCESPGIYVYDLNNLQWVQQFTSSNDDGSSESNSGSDSDSDSDSDSAPSNSNSEGKGLDNNPFNQQPEQMGTDGEFGGLEGSYGYRVPKAVFDKIGGDKLGGATITEPVATATAGPLATGEAETYTVTRDDGSTTTGTSSSDNNSNSSSSSNSDSDSGPNIAAIVVGSVCGVLFIIICYLLFCLYLYRRQLALYKNHVEMSQRQARGEKLPAIPGLWTSNSHSPKHSAEGGGGGGGNGTLLGSSTHGGPSGSSANAGTSYQGSRGAHVASSHGQGSSGGEGVGGGDAGGYQSVRRGSGVSDSEDLMSGQEPTFVGVMLHPRKSLRIVNKD